MTKLQLSEIKKAFSRFPQEMQRESAKILNAQGFTLRALMIEEIERSMTIRNKGLTRRFVRYERTSGSRLINQQIVRVGSLSEDRFSGWAPQQSGHQSGAMMILSAARGNSGKQIPQGKRLPAGGKVPTPGLLGFTGTGKQMTVGFAAMMARRGYQGVFGLENDPRLYTITSRAGARRTKFKAVRRTDRTIITRSNPWATRANQTLLSSGHGDQWVKGIAEAARRVLGGR